MRLGHRSVADNFLPHCRTSRWPLPRVGSDGTTEPDLGRASMNRRDFLKFSGLGLGAVAVGSAGGWTLIGPVAQAGESSIDLTMVEVDHEMVDGVLVPGWAFRTSLQAGGVALGPRIPGPVLFARQGEKVRLLVRNDIPKGGAHAFAIPGVVATRPLQAGEEVAVEFTAPKAGTYLYLDPLNAPVNRVLGLHGPFVVLPPEVGYRTPFTDATPAIEQLFDDLGTTPHFPGHYWDRDRNALWVFSTLDPDKHWRAAGHASGMDAADFAAEYTPQYFTINGKSGFFSAQHGASPHDPGAGDHGHGAGGEEADHHDPRSPDVQAAISVHGLIGQPVLIRALNAGLMWHSPHIHGNHVYVLATDRVAHDNLLMVDTWASPPLTCVDLLLPYIRPPDIPEASWAYFEQGLNQELFPLTYPMHDHNEISNTAAGANYPQGLATHFQFDGPIEWNDGVIQVDRGEVRLRTGHLSLSGRCSGPPGNSLMIHAGDTPNGPVLGNAIIGPDGSWSFRGRALQALASRTVTIHDHATGCERRGVPLDVR